MNQSVLIISSSQPLGEPTAEILRQAGTLGLWEMSDREWRAYFHAEEESIEVALLSLDPDLSLSWETHEPVDWVQRYQASLRPIPVGRRFVILPSPDLDNPCPGRIPLDLVPGMAFGTGEHFTTASCLRTLEALSPAPSSVLDLGCGTGILAAAAWKLGARNVLACDIDPEACAVSRETARVNGTPFAVALGSTDVSDERFDCVLANILGQTLVELMPGIASRVARGGRLIGSGILLNLGRDVLNAASLQGFRPVQQRTNGEWWTFLWRAE
jgi:ribosomal protein L11 methyltransferase